MTYVTGFVGANGSGKTTTLKCALGLVRWRKTARPMSWGGCAPERGVATVMATLGAAGAVLVTAEGAWHAAAPKIHVLSTVGAGDSSVAGYVLADVRGGDEPERLRTAEIMAFCQSFMTELCKYIGADTDEIGRAHV